MTGRDDLIDTAGTGGGRQTFNVSTTAALIAAGAGCAVAKHGNRSATGPVRLRRRARGARRAHRPAARRRSRSASSEVGFGFMFAPGAPRRDPLRRAGAQGARGAHDLQLPRPADEPGRAPRGRSSGCPTRRFLEVIARRAGAARRAQGAGRLERGRPRRAQHVAAPTRVVEVDDGDAAHLRGDAGGRRPARAPPTRTSRAGRRTANAATDAAHLRGRAGSGA